MEQIGWSLVDTQTGSEIQHGGDTPGVCIGWPDVIRLPNGDFVHCPAPGPVGENINLLPRYGQRGTDPIAVQADKVIVSIPVTPSDVAAERSRRLALGFDYPFGDARGTHRIGTTRPDLDGWAEVATYAGALIDSGDITTKIHIVTDTGPCEITAPEWRAIEIAAAAFRQPIWAHSFALLASNPIPADYTDDIHWT